MNTFIVNLPNHPYKLEVRWTERLWSESDNLTRLGDGGIARGHLERSLDSIYGVERVIMHRYAAEVFFAAHLVTAEQLAKEVISLLKNYVDLTKAEVIG